MQSNKDMKTQTIEGGYIVPCQDSHISKWQIETQRLDHDQFLVPFCVSKIKPGDVVIDGGAFDGDHTIAYSKAVGDDGAVFAIEAGKEAYECLVFNAKRFPNKNVVALQVALSDSRGTVMNHLINPNLGASKCGINGESTNLVMTVTIDFLRENCEKKIDFIKLDIEGCEVKALQGAEKVLKEDRPLMVIEVNKSALIDHFSIEDQLFELLHKAGYKWKIIEPECKLKDPQYNIFCEPEL